MNDWFSNLLLEPALLFNQCAIPIFTNFNYFYKVKNPLSIYLNHPLARKLAARIIKPVVLRNVSSVKEIDLSDDTIFIDVKSIFLGGTTKTKLNRLLNEGDITQDQYSRSHDDAQCHFRDALAYIQEKFPITNEVFCNSVWIDVVKRHETNWNSVEYFLEKFSRVSFMEVVDWDELFEEFSD